MAANPEHRFVGIYHDESNASRAVRELIDAHVPVDEVSVIVRDSRGEHEVPVRFETNIAKGGIAGATLGATLASVGATLVSLGALGGPVGLVAAGPVLAALQGAALGAGGGGLLGVLVGLGHWGEKADLHDEDLQNGAAVISVRNPAQQEAAWEVFKRTGADRIDDRQDAGPERRHARAGR